MLHLSPCLFRETAQISLRQVSPSHTSKIFNAHGRGAPSSNKWGKPFICSQYDGSLHASPNEGDVRAREEHDPGEQLAGDNDDGDNQRDGRSPSPISSCTARTAAQRDDLEPSQQLLHCLLLDTLEGISFLTEQVACLTEENRRLRTERERSTEQQVLLVCSLRDEVKASESRYGAFALRVAIA
ncbi:hypothetical protein IscW_ISCW012384 [Ixodes scapularis]|uniref:Uncharacterized protein n=1 Tax=Ixodes scapularis TaxID=6945 RepID=B7QC43_IXOSC|nr:hypothetical protein IscW_ISCW012384 [Ixodes scapularis]|eukprot:XP_002413107.1 hypothetical protein IscW_ISCW012384 [Ixodes scapularis]